MIQDVDESIRRLIVGELVAAGGSLIKDESQIVFGLPSDEPPKDKKPQLNIYLHDVRENLALRDEQFHVKKSTSEWEIGKRPGAIRLDLSYILSVSAADPLTEHRVLGEVLAALIRNGVVPEKYLAQSLKDELPNSLLISVAQPDHPAHSDHPKLWQSIGSTIKPTVTLVATAKFNPYETKFVKLVREAIFALGQGIHPEGPDRQMDIRSVRLSAAGMVADKKEDRPLANVTVSILGREEQTTTDDRGFFFFLNLPPNRYTLRFSRRGYKVLDMETVAPPPGRSDTIEPMDVSLTRLTDSEKEKEDATVRQEVLRAPSFIETGRRITVSLVGTLRFPDGTPAPYIPVRIGGRTAVTDEDGSYHFTGLAPGEHQIVAEIPGRGEIPVLPSGGTATLPEADGNGKKVKAKAP
ncbi:MAG TPA: Pvc16 family protein [Fimbriimonadaceae bacterium]|nr:Pvc16 family protein [Fimbriimonadaceae bacterium]